MPLPMSRFLWLKRALLPARMPPKSPTTCTHASGLLRLQALLSSPLHPPPPPQPVLASGFRLTSKKLDQPKGRGVAFCAAGCPRRLRCWARSLSSTRPLRLQAARLLLLPRVLPTPYSLHSTPTLSCPRTVKRSQVAGSPVCRRASWFFLFLFGL